LLHFVVIITRLKSSFGNADRRGTADEQHSNLIRDPSQATVYSTMDLAAQHSKGNGGGYSSFVQLKALLWKSWIIRRVHYISSFFEVLCPVLFMLLICWTMNGLTAPSDSDDNNSTTTNTTLGPIIYTDAKFYVHYETRYDFATRINLFYAPQSPQTERLMSTFLRDNNTFVTLTAFNTEKDVDIQLELMNKTDQKVGLYAGIVFENLTPENIVKGHVEYKIKILTGSQAVQIILLKFPMKTSQAPVEISNNLESHTGFYAFFMKYQQ